MNDVRKMGRVTIPTDTDAVSKTLDLLKRWGRGCIRDCDGTEFPQELKDTGAKIYATYTLPVRTTPGQRPTLTKPSSATL